MSRETIDPTTLGWLRFGGSGVAARGAYLTLLALGHVAFLWCVLEKGAQGLAAASAFAGCNVMVLGWVAFRRRLTPLSVPDLLGRIIGMSMALVLLVALGVGRLSDRGLDSEVILAISVFSVVAGCVCGLLGSIVAVPLGLALDRWRSDPIPRRGLDAWARLAITGSVAFLLTSMMRSPNITGDGLVLAAASTMVHAVLPVAWLLLSIGLWLVECVARRDLARLPHAPSGAYRWVEAAAALPAVAPSWALTGAPCDKALVRDVPSAVYRERGGVEVVAWWPGHEPRSWRDGALLSAIGLGALGLLIRFLA